jgi:multidrug transporter EmrE-like cation transporter
MAERIALYLILALLASFLLALGLLMMKSCARRLPAAHGRGIVRALIRWLRDPVWVTALVIQALGYGLSVVAMAGAPVSLVSVMMQGGIALFVIFAVIFLHERAQPIEWLGISAIIIAIVILALSLSSGAAEGGVDDAMMTALSGASLVAILAAYSSERLRHNGIAAALTSGIFFGLSSIYTKALTYSFAGTTIEGLAFRLLESPYLYLVVVTNILGLILLQNSFHAARGLIVMPISSALSNILPIIGGLLVFGESLPAEPFDAGMRAGAFALTIVGSALLAATREPGKLPAKAEAMS